MEFIFICLLIAWLLGAPFKEVFKLAAIFIGFVTAVWVCWGLFLVGFGTLILNWS